MGAGASTGDSVDKQTAQQLAGDKWDEVKFDSVAVDGVVTKAQWDEAAGSGCEDGAATPRTETGAATKVQKLFRGKLARSTLFVAGFVVRAANRFDYYKKLGISDEQLDSIKSCFNRYNIDNDNSISSNELRAAIHDMEDEEDHESHMDPTGVEFQKMFQEIDQNGNDEIELGEFCKWWVSGADDMDSNFMKWWFKRRWGELTQDPEFLKSEVRQFVPPPKKEMDEEIENAYAQNADVDISEIKERIHPLATVKNVPVTDDLSITYAALSQRGYYPESLNKANQDAYIVKTQFNEKPNEHFFGVFDGHGQYGDWVSNFVRDNIIENFQSMLSMKKGNVDEAFTQACLFTDQQMHCTKDRLSGTTLVAAYMKGKTVHIANIGDSRAVLASRGDGKLYATALTHDQTPYRRDERERCKKTGCRVMNMDQLEGYEEMHDNWDVELGEEIDDGGDPPRIWHGSKNLPGCAFTRSLGDQVAIPWGVFAEPELATHDLSEKDQMLIIASDGVWEFITNQGAVDMCSKYTDPLEACRHVVAEAYKMWMIHDIRTDDITMIRIDLEWANTDQSVQDNEGASKAFRHRGVTKNKQKQIELSGFKHDDSEPFDIAKYTFEKEEATVKAIRESVNLNSLFQSLSSTDKDKAVSCFEEVNCKADDILIKQGDAGSYYYIAKSGEYEVLLKDPVDKKAGLGPCVHTYITTDAMPSFGELSLIHPQPCAASVSCKKEGIVWRIAKHPFRAIVTTGVTEERKKSVDNGGGK